jgi:hypothetical protein
MANANPSRSGSNNPIVKSVVVDTTVGINDENQVVSRKTLASGATIDTHVFPGEFPDAQKFSKPKSEAAKKVADTRTKKGE